jgi:hypothetical protein
MIIKSQGQYRVDHTNPSIGSALLSIATKTVSKFIHGLDPKDLVTAAVHATLSGGRFDLATAEELEAVLSAAATELKAAIEARKAADAAAIVVEEAPVVVDPIVETPVEGEPVVTEPVLDTTDAPAPEEPKTKKK